MSEKYVAYDTRAEAQAAIAAADSLGRFPRDTAQTCSQIIEHSGKFLVVVPDYFPDEWFAVADRKTAAQIGYSLPEPNA